MQSPELLHVGFLSGLLLGILGACFLEPRGWREWAVATSLGLFLGSIGEAYLGLLLRGPEGWPWDTGPLPYSPSIWRSAWPARSWIGTLLLVLSLALTLGGLVLLGLRWSAVQATRNTMETAEESRRRRRLPCLSILLLSGGLLLAWPTWLTIAVWLVLLAFLAVTRWRFPCPSKGCSAGGPEPEGVQGVQ